MNDEYVRKDVHDVQVDHLLDMIAVLDKRIDDMKDSMNRILTVTGVFVSVITVVLSIVFYMFK